MNTFYFNTGVRPHTISNPPFPYDYHKKAGHVIKGGTLQIPFDCDAPKDATIIMLCNPPDLPEGKAGGVLVCEVSNTTMASKYAYMRRATCTCK